MNKGGLDCKWGGRQPPHHPPVPVFTQRKDLDGSQFSFYWAYCFDKSSFV